MATRFSRKTAEGKIEYYDSKEEMNLAEEAQSLRSMSICGAIIGFLLVGYYVFMAINTYVPDWYKTVRFTIVLVSAAMGATVAYYATVYLVGAIFIFVAIGIVIVIGRFIWSMM